MTRLGPTLPSLVVLVGSIYCYWVEGLSWTVFASILAVAGALSVVGHQLGTLALYFLQFLFDSCVHATATFLVAVMSHPDVEAALSRTMVRGMTEFMVQPNLDVHMRVMSESLSRNNSALVAKAGQDFPKLVGTFIQGMMSPKKPLTPTRSESSLLPRKNSSPPAKLDSEIPLSLPSMVEPQTPPTSLRMRS